MNILHLYSGGDLGFMIFNRNEPELLSNVVYGHIESSGGLLNRNHFNSIYESCAFYDFGQVTKAS